MKQLDPHTMSTGDVAKALDRSVDRVKELDTVLRPVRKSNGHRRYDPKLVARYIASRG